MRTIFAFVSVMLIVVIDIGCSSRSVEPRGETVVEQDQKTTTSSKLQGSIFTVIELEDLEYPTLAASIHLPFRVRPNNTVVLSGKHAYLTTERHLHVINISIPQRPSYLTSLAFSDEIGKCLVFGDYVVIGTPRKFHLVNVSEPSVPVLESTGHLPQRNPIKDFDVKNARLYTMGANDVLYVFSTVFGQVRLDKAVKMSPRWWLLSPKADSPDVKQILLSIGKPIPQGGLSEALLSQNGFLQISSSKQEKVRASSEFLVLEGLRDPTCDLLTFDAYKVSEHRMKSSMGFYNVEREYRDHLSATREKTLTRGEPTIAYAVDSGKMQQIALEPSGEAIDIDDKHLIGPVTDFQISGDLLCVVNEKGFFSIKHLIKIEDRGEGVNYWRDRFLSATPLQASHPMSLAVGENYAYVLAAREDSRK